MVRQPTLVVVIEHASTSSSALHTFFSIKTFFVFLFLLRDLFSFIHIISFRCLELTQTQFFLRRDTPYFPEMFSNFIFFFFSFPPFSWRWRILVLSWCLVSTAIVQPRLPLILFLILFPSLSVLVCPGADELDAYPLSGMEQALRTTAARLRVPCRVISWPPIHWTKSGRVCETSTALNE